MQKIYIHILLSVLTVLTAVISTSCAQEEIYIQDSNSGMQIIGRIPNFESHYVNTKSVKTSEENKIYNMTLLVFDRSSDGALTDLKDIQKIAGSAAIFIIDKHNLDGNETIYLLANVQHLFGSDWTPNNKTFADLQMVTESHNGIGIPRNGFPMVGSKQLNETILNSQKIEIELEMLYAKIELNLNVNATQITPNTPKFKITSCYVHNVPAGIYMVDNVIDNQSKFYNNTLANGIELTSANVDTELTNGESNKYTFYMPEHFIKPAIDIDSYDYPDGILETEKQRYKPKFVETENSAYDAKPTYVIIRGIYTDHQKHIHQVEYKVYLGDNPINNFQIERNGHYINDITIKGVTNSNYDNGENVSIDHRVHIERNDFFVYIERETMVDSHFEVRPLRVIIDNDANGNPVGTVLVELENSGDWIKLEQKKTASADDPTYCTNGKRKYFTKNLLLDSKLGVNCTIPDNNNNCVWLYIDEYIETINVTDKTEDKIQEAANEQKRKTRNATLKLTFNPTDGSKPTIIKKYNISQRCIYPIVSKSRKDNYGKPYIYYIEFYEEYLHNFDSYDDFGLTNEEGMEWGLDGVQLSHEHTAYYIGSGFKNKQFNASEDILSNYRYDFYISKNECINKNEFDNKESNPIAGTDYFPFSGYQFTTEIVDYLKGTDNKIQTLPLDTKPESAIEYCYNKNKAQDDKTTLNINWYMPSIDELEDIISSAYTEFEVFQEKFYWSCQPAYELLRLFPVQNQNALNNFDTSLLNSPGPNDKYGIFYNDNIVRARATRMIYQGMGSNPEYLPSASGVKQTNKGFIAFQGNGNTGPKEFNIQLILDDGNKARTELCRVRAIYNPNPPASN